MCGIAGLIDFTGGVDVQGEVEAMTASLDHRGPDGHNIFVRSAVGLGHSRLAIIDLERGCQPMFSSDRKMLITFNGEIYNYRELRSELQAWGYEFRTTSDTEVILAAYIRYGPKCVSKLSGMFAFGIADYRRRCLFLARDHVGVKPLVYWMNNRFFAFASELRALRHITIAKPTGSLQSVDFFLRYQYIPAPDTIYNEIQKLPPAHCLEIPFDRPSGSPKRYWRLHFREPGPHADQAAISEKVESAVRRSMIADVPVGLFLSGGIDSTLVARMALKCCNRPLKAFSIGYTLQQYSELKYAKQAARRLGIEHYIELLEPDALEALPELVDHYGEPFGDSSCIPTWHVSKLARKQVKTVLSGDGGDEAFAGYDRYFRWLHRPLRHLPRHNEFMRAVSSRPRFSMKNLLNILGYGPEAWSRFIYTTLLSERLQLWRSDLKHLAYSASPVFWDAWRHARGGGALAHAQSIDFETYLPGAILTKVDVASMCHGIEVRPALLDKELLEAAATLPQSLKYTTGMTGKIVLQNMLENIFPERFIRRPKRGFVIPRDEWMSPGHSGYMMLRDLLSDSSLPLRDWFNYRRLEHHLQRQEAGFNKSQNLWLLLILALWANQNRDISFHCQEAA